MKSERQVVDLIRRNLLFLVIAAIIIGSLVFFNLYRRGILGPIVGDSERGITLIWKVSDHQSDSSPLENSLLANDEPKYLGDLVVELKRNNSGNLESLPRFQGQLEYFKN